MPLGRNVPLFNFAFHERGWLEQMAKIAKTEPWGKELKVLELYLRSNFEIAKAQNKVYEDREAGVAFWRTGHLVNMTSDPVWLVYRKNNRDEPFWRLDAVRVGDVPVAGKDPSFYQVTYNPPEFEGNWSLYFEQYSLEHMLQDTRNKERLEKVFEGIFSTGTLNDHIVFRTVYAEIELKRKEAVVLPQWYHGDYQFLMPLFLTQNRKVELTAALRPEPALKRYSVRTLLLPTFAYAYARSVVKSRTFFADWMLLSEEDLERAADEKDEAEGEE